MGMEDTSLDEFLETAGEDEAVSDEGDGGAAASDETNLADCDGDEPVVDAEPATTTAQWSPAGSECEQCETTVNRLWVDDGTAVCRSCKDW